MQACNIWLPRCPSYNMNAWVVHIGKRRLSKPRDCHQILTSSRTERRPTVLSTLPCRYLPAKSVNGYTSRRPSQRIVCRRRDMRRPIRIDHAGRWLDQQVAILADQPLCSDELDEQPSSSPVVSAAACNSTGRLDRSWLAAHVTR